jgi:hypothetical protein
LLIKVLEDENWAVRFDGIEVIGKLANHGEWQLKRIAAELTRTTKPSFVNPLQARFDRSPPLFEIDLAGGRSISNEEIYSLNPTIAQPPS